MTPPERRLVLAGTWNVRDVGGYRTASGARTRWRTLLRGDGLHRLGAESHRTLTDLGLRRVVDLREAAERDAEPDALDGLELEAVWCPLNPWGLDTADGMHETLGDVYLALIEQRGEQVAAAVAALCEDDALPALVHCTAGKDRTGIVIALALSAVGVSDTDVVKDFALTARYLGADMVAQMERRLARAGLPQVARIQIAGADPAWMTAVLAMIDDRHEGAAGYLLDHGLTPDQLERLRAGLLTRS